tara:strand:+ start:95 stop:511 length:417 start_codon:yes stop_codon:yes gene_type:complete
MTTIHKDELDTTFPIDYYYPASFTEQGHVGDVDAARVYYDISKRICYETHTQDVKGISLADWKKYKKIYDCVCCTEQGYSSCCPPHKRCKVKIEEYWEDKKQNEYDKCVRKLNTERHAYKMNSCGKMIKNKHKLKIVG